MIYASRHSFDLAQHYNMRMNVYFELFKSSLDRFGMYFSLVILYLFSSLDDSSSFMLLVNGNN